MQDKHRCKYRHFFYKGKSGDLQYIHCYVEKKAAFLSEMTGKKGFEIGKKAVRNRYKRTDLFCVP